MKDKVWGDPPNFLHPIHGIDVPHHPGVLPGLLGGAGAAPSAAPPGVRQLRTLAAASSGSSSGGGWSRGSRLYTAQVGLAQEFN